MKPSVVVVGAGALGGWTALFLLEAGCAVTLVELVEPGHDGSSSGDASRVFRHTYANPVFTRMASRARSLWLERQTRWGVELYRETGMLWLVATQQDEVERQGMANLAWAGIDHEALPAGELARRFPWVRPGEALYGIWEAQAGFLKARLACQTVVRALEGQGGQFVRGKAVPSRHSHGRMGILGLEDGSQLRADHFVFACGSWLKTIFPELLASKIRPTRQEVHYFQLPETWTGPSLVWADHGADFWYGIIDRESATVKVADDTRGEDFDPETDPRTPSVASRERAQDQLAQRFPLLATAPWVSSRVCHYENTPDHNLIFDRLPGVENAWILGGGSGHAFKHGPAIGEWVGATLLAGAATVPQWSLARF